MQILAFAIACLAIAFILYLGRVLILWDERRKLERNGYRKLSFPKLSNRGHVDQGFMRGIVEFGVLVLMLIAVLSWMGFSMH